MSFHAGATSFGDTPTAHLDSEVVQLVTLFVRSVFSAELLHNGLNGLGFVISRAVESKFPGHGPEVVVGSLFLR